MLMIYHSNRLDILEEIMEFIIEHERLDNPFESEIVLVQNSGMARWLQISISQKFNIAANIEFSLPANFIWKMFTHILPDIPQHSVFSKQSMSWKLMSILPNMLQYKEFAMLKYYLRNDTDRQKLFQLTSYIADLYDKYLTYRPDWLSTWESGLLVHGLPESQVWQACLWKELVKLTKQLGQPQWHRANLYKRFLTAIESIAMLSGLPSRVFVCGISTLPPVYLDILKALSKYIDIHILFTNPCRYYWGDIKDPNWLTRLTMHQRYRLFEERSVSLFKDDRDITFFFDDNGIQTLSNPLLSSWGKLGRDYIHMLSDTSLSGERDIDAFSEIIPDSLLHNVQLDILNLENRAIVDISNIEFAHNNIKHYLDPNDHSLTIHVCHSPQREVEVLHDQLLSMLQDDLDLTPRDIIVMVTDIDSYTPFIQAVFGGVTGDRYIPYVILDQRVRQFHPIIQAFINLLSLLESRFISEDVLAILQVPIIGAKFNFNEDNLWRLRQWINESGIRWGLDDDNVKEFKLPDTGQHTW